jgi:hypothetical protein
VTAAAGGERTDFPTPIFLFSLPRSGSTLVQRVLAAHEDVATVPEPWLLLPQLFALRERGIVADYGQVPASRALREFAGNLPGGRSTYDAELRAFVERLYARAAGEGARYFVDKTPRYHLIAEELFGLFPDARFVFLWRNPLAVAASIVETWGGGRWIVDRYRLDLREGVENLVHAFEARRGRAISVRYEDLIGASDDAWRRLFEALDLSFDPGVLTRFADIRLEARMGDPTGARSYDKLSEEPLDKWRSTLRGPVRTRWARGYLRWVGAERLAVMGYDQAELIGEIGGPAPPPRTLASDAARSVYGSLAGARKRRAMSYLQRRKARGEQKGPGHRA